MNNRPNFRITTFVPKYDDRDAVIGGRWVTLDTAETLGWATHKFRQLEERFNHPDYCLTIMTADYQEVPFNAGPTPAFDPTDDDIPF